MECGFNNKKIECNEECEYFATCTLNPLNKKKVAIVKDRECVSCTKLFDCKGKPRGVTCVNYEERKRDGR